MVVAAEGRQALEALDELSRVPRRGDDRVHVVGGGRALVQIEEEGDLDLAIANEGPGSHVWLFENQVGNANNWLTVRLEGAGCDAPGECNCSGVGARVTVTTALGTQFREVTAGKAG